MTAAVAGFCIAFALCALSTPAMGALFRKMGILDRPDGLRKTHSTATPRAGGLPIAFSFVAASIILSFALEEVRNQIIGSPWLLSGAAFVLATGLLDDVHGLKPWQKLLGQIAGAVAAYLGGICIVSDTSDSFWWSFPLTVLWLVTCTNAFNLIDGVDGLATGLGTIAASAMAIAGLLLQDVSLAFEAALLSGALAAFFLYNFRPASVFLGDGGSLLVGLLLGALATNWMRASQTPLGIVAPAMVLAVPLTDTMLAVLRRFIRRDPVFGADRAHVHHRLLEMGYSRPQVVLILCGLAAVGAAIAVYHAVPHGGYTLLVTVLIWCAVLCEGIRRLGYVELGAAFSSTAWNGFRDTLRAGVIIQEYRSCIDSARSKHDCWNALCETSQRLGFTVVELSTRTFDFSKHSVAPREHNTWDLRIPVSGSGYIRLASSAVLDSLVVAQYIQVLSHELTPKLAAVCGESENEHRVPSLMKRMREHGPGDIALFLAAAVLLRVTKVALNAFALRKVTAFVTLLCRHEPSRPDPEDAIRVSWAIEAASRSMAPEGKCLFKALTAQVLLARQGCEARLHIGAHKSRTGAYAAHAWLELGGNVLVGGPTSELAQYTWHTEMNQPKPSRRNFKKWR
jgi:UDP-GlcNAc:undecaprenyl-phosphate/decaprenyl-phosphate GlcNAc-1-phosphate transferase